MAIPTLCSGMLAVAILMIVLMSCGFIPNGKGEDAYEALASDESTATSPLEVTGLLHEEDGPQQRGAWEQAGKADVDRVREEYEAKLTEKDRLLEQLERELADVNDTTKGGRGEGSGSERK